MTVSASIMTRLRDRLSVHRGGGQTGRVLPGEDQPWSNRPTPWRARGAARAPPCPGTPWSVTAIATLGLEAGANAMNHTLLIAAPICVSAVPVFPATCTPGICAAVPVPSFTTASIIEVTAVAVEGLI